ncbi:amino acid adenylation domain-containing protein [Streptomyces sp. NPDC001851]|uniref:amino acid adenylation domain-containing protein n=1 Tax=Streptomyces sp. NPDC001851 TaxID=3154529 RepID=UPI003325F079
MSERTAAELAAIRQELIRRRLRGHGPQAAPKSPAAPVVPERPGPRRDTLRPVLSSAQRRMWFLDRLLPGSPAYNIPAAYRLRGPLDPAALDRALVTVVGRHEALRTRFSAADGEPFQIIEPAPDQVLRREDASGPPASSARGGQVTVEALCAAEAATPFDLTAGPLLRARLVRLAADDHLFLVTVHHSVFDGTSAGVFVRELSEAYAAHAQGRQPELPLLPLQYADFAAGQREWLGGAETARQSRYWREQLADITPLELPTDRPRPAVAGHRAVDIDFEVPVRTVRGVRELARSHGTTAFVVTLAAQQALLARYCGSDDIVVGTPVSGRSRSELEPMIGFFVNTLPLRARLGDDPPFTTLVDRLRETALDAYAHQDLPFEQLVEELSPSRDLSRNPIFQVWFGLLNQGSAGELAALDLPGIEATDLPTGEATTRFDLELHLYDAGGDRLTGRVICAQDLFEETTARRFARHYLHLLDAVVRDPSLRVSQAPLTPPDERRAAVAVSSGPAEPWEQELSTAALFERQATATPQAVALVCGETEMTYAELNARANRLARFLRERGVGPEVLVGLCLRRGPEMLVGLLAVLKAGGACVPMDPETPPERLRYILDQSAVLLTVTQSDLAGSLLAGEPVVRVDADHDEIEAHPGGNLPGGAGPDHLMYVIYTSGSTGRPKGVMMTHRPILNLVSWQLRRTSAHGPTLQFAAINFDISFQELFTSWAAGERVVLPVEEERRDPEQLLALMAEHGVRRFHCPPPVLEQVAAAAARGSGAHTALPPLSEIVPAGEQLRLGAELRTLLDRLPGVAVDNQYGPTEAHVVTAFRMTGDTAGWPDSPPVGTPIANVRVYLLDGNLEPVPPGLPGEVYVAGPCLSRGYLRRPDLTARAFLPDPFAGEPGDRMYRTGDQARRREDGTLEYLGRTDFQVKIRGYRIEPEEVEASLAELPGVVRAIVTVTAAAAGGQQLVAYAQTAPGSPLGADDLIAGLRRRLPAYMIPAALVVLDELPLSVSGKVDRSRLPRPVANAEDYVAPRDEAERAVAEIWRRALKVERVGLRDNFFELGGHSLAVPQVVYRVREHFGIDLPLRTMFDQPVLEDFAAAAREAGHGVAEPAKPVTFRGLSRPAPGRTQLFCLPFAGGGTDGFDAWLPPLADRFDVHVALLPGRGARFTEAMPHSTDELVPAIAAEMRPFLGEHVVLFGHSLGALLAYELARELQRSYGVSPACLVVSGQTSPQRRDPAGLHKLPPEEMLRALAEFGGVDPAVFDEPELLELVVPTLRADVAMAETYRWSPGPPLDCPLVVYGSHGDPGTTRATLAGWRETTTGPVETRLFPGGHFHFNDDPEGFAADLLRRLAPHLPTGPR